MEGGNPGTNRPNAQHPQAGDPEAGYHEYHEIVPEVTEGPGFDNYGSVNLY